MPPAGLDNLRHIVILMMENRSFDHMLGGLSLVMQSGAKKYPKINGLTGNESNFDMNGAMVFSAAPLWDRAASQTCKGSSRATPRKARA